jgi:hypothetical protein
MELTINPEFHSLIPPISAEEYQLLEESITNEGCRDAIVTWDNCILDGHNRYEICQKHHIGFHTLEKEFDTEDEAKIWIIHNQLGRRNLTREQISYLIGLRYNLEKKEVGHPENQCGHFGHIKRTAEKIAEETGVSARTVRRDAKFAKAVDELPSEEKQKVLAGKSKKTKKEITESKKPKKKKVKLGPPSNGMQFARMAIMDLEKITDDDLEREEAFASVKEWIQDITLPIYLERREREAEEAKKKEEEIDPLLEKVEEDLTKEEKAKVNAYWKGEVPSPYYLHKEKFERCEEAWLELSKSQKKEFVKRHCEKEVNPITINRRALPRGERARLPDERR